MTESTKIIDMHTHAFPDGLAPRAIATLEAGAPWQAVGDGTVGDLLGSMDTAGVAVSAVCAIATKPGQAEGILDWCRAIRSDRIAPLPSVHPETPDADQWIEKIVAEGFAGVKLHPMYQDFAIDESRLDRLYVAAAACGLFVAMHCGRDIGFPEDDDRAAPIRLRRTAEKFPKLTLLGTHLGGWRMWEAVRNDLLGADVYLETSFSLDELWADEPAELIRRHGIDRILNGSDWPWQRQSEQIRLTRELGLDESELAAVLGGNAARLLGR